MDEILHDQVKACVLRFLVHGADAILLKSRNSPSRFSLTHKPQTWCLLPQETEPSTGLSIVSGSAFPVTKLLAFAAVMMMKLVGWQVHMFLNSIAFPFKICGLAAKALVLRPVVRVLRGCFIHKLRAAFMRHSFAMAVYLCVMLVGLLASGMVLGGFFTSCFVEEPVQFTDTLNFDYTQPSPLAFVPLKQPIPTNRHLHLTVSLQMPESDYNRNLGIFQVKVESMSSDGKVASSARQPCMLKFKGQAIRLAETIMRSIPLLTGFLSESQVLDIKIHKFIEQGIDAPTCLRVIIEQRAEFKPGTGIPEIYSASLKLESELPLMKMMIWKWRRTFFIWASLFWFLTQLMVIILFYRSLLIPIRFVNFHFRKKVISSPGFFTSASCKSKTMLDD